jgi:plasmid stability protein
MKHITIRLSDEMMRRLAERAAQNGRTIEDEAKQILMDALFPNVPD